MTKQELIASIQNLAKDPNFAWRFEQNQSGNLVCTQNLADAKWVSVFHVSGLKEVIKLILKFDEQSKVVRHVTERSSVSWQAGLPVIGFNVSKSRGQTWGMQMKKGYGIGTDGKFGELYSYKINLNDIAPEIKAVVESQGWQWKRDFSDPSVRISLFFAAIGGAGALLVILLAIFGAF